jgi:transcriptional regulator with XRE-family HTH domain
MSRFNDDAEDERRLIGRNIHVARMAAGHANQRTFAELLGVKQGQFSEWERGRRAPDPTNLRKLEHALNKPRGWFNAEHDEYQA